MARARPACAEAPAGADAGGLAGAARSARVLEDILARCLDGAIASRGAILVREEAGRLTVRVQRGYSPAEVAVLHEVVAAPGIVADALAGTEPVTLAPATLPQSARVIAGRRRGDRALFAPIAAGGERLGALVIGDAGRSADQEWLAFAGAVASQVAHALLLIRAVSELARAEEKYRRIFDSAAVGIFQTTPAGAIVAANDTFARMLGYASPAELRAAVGSDMGPLYVDRSRRQALVAELEARGSAVGFEAQVRRADGGVIWTSASVRAIRTGEGETLFEGVLEDVTAQKRAEEATAALAETGRRLSESLDMAVIGSLVSEAAVRVLGASAAAVYRKDRETSAFRLLSRAGGDGAFTWMSELEPGMGLAAVAVREKRVIVSADVLGDPRVTYPRAIAERLERSRHRSMVALPLLAREKLAGVLVVADRLGRQFAESDVDLARTFVDRAAAALENAQLYAEAERRRQEAEVMAALLARISVSPDLDGLLLGVAEGAWKLCSADRAAVALCDHATGHMAFRHWVGSDPGSDPEDAGRGAGGWVLATRQPFRTASCADDPRLAAFGDSRARPGGLPASQLVVPVVTDKGVEGLLFVENDLSRPFTGADEAVLGQLAGHAAIAIGNARRHEALVQSEKLATMGQLLAGVAHELNNPLTVVLGRAGVLDKILGASPSAHHAQKVHEAARRCARIVKNFLALVRQRRPERQMVALNSIVHDAIEIMAYALRVDEIEVCLELADDAGPLWADPQHLHQVMVNLISNAHHAMRSAPKPRRLRIRTWADRARRLAVLEVEDSGPGIAPEIRERVFDPFFTTKPDGQGTGLGLSLCREMIEEHAGAIRVAGCGGSGASIVIELPIRTEPEPPEQDPAPSPRPIVRDKTILVVDDEAEITALLGEILSADGHRVDAATDGLTALRMLEVTRYDLVLSDVRMPGMDGPALFRELSARNPETARRLVFMTGDTLAPETAAILERLARPILSKPLNQAELIATVERIVGASAGVAQRDRGGITEDLGPVPPITPKG